MPPAQSTTPSALTTERGRASRSPAPARPACRGGDRPDLGVPMREVVLSLGDSVVLYDTSGPHTDPALQTDVRLGLAEAPGR